MRGVSNFSVSILSLILFMCFLTGIFPDPAFGVIELTRVTTVSDGNRDCWYPDISADGSKVVFTSDSDFLGQGIPVGQYEIWLYDAPTGNMTRVTTASHGGRSSVGPAISADGNKVVFTSDSDFLGQGIPAGQEEIWLYDVATANLTRVTTASAAGKESGGPAINGDGSKVVFRSDSEFLGPGIPDGQWEIWLYDVPTANLTRVTTASAANRRSLGAAISADGSKVAFTSDSDFLSQGIPDEQYEIWLYDIATANLTRVTTASAADRDSHSPAISADGSKVALASNSDFLGQGIPAAQSEIWLYDAATTNLTRLTTASPSGRSSETPGISADGSKVAFASDSDFLGQGIPAGPDEIWLYDVATTNLTRVTTAPHVNWPFTNSFSPAISADGYKVVFMSDSDFLGQGIAYEQHEIWIAFDGRVLTVEKDGGGTGTVTSHPAGIDCGLDCNDNFGVGTQVVLTGAPDAGSALDGWTGPDCPGNGTCTVPMDRDITVTATFNVDTDGDGISDTIENAGPNNGDANQDGIPDFEQPDVATFPDIHGLWCTLIAESGTFFRQVTFTVNPSPSDAPEGVAFPCGFFGFNVHDLAPGGSTMVTLILNELGSEMGYLRYGPTPDNTQPHWYPFLFDGTTGMKFSRENNQIRIHFYFQDGGRGDDDLTMDGVIMDLGGPATAGSSGGGGGGICFISTGN